MTFFAESPCPKMVFPVKSVSLIAQSCQQGYTAAMVVDESRILQVRIFSTLHRNERRVKFSKLLPDVMTIQKGNVKFSVLSASGKVAVVAMLMEKRSTSRTTNRQLFPKRLCRK